MSNVNDLASLWQSVAIALSVALLAVGAWCDVLARIIPDWISLALAAVGLSSRVSVGIGAGATAIGIALLVFFALSFVHARGGLGGGDVKLMSAAAAGLSPLGVYQMLMATAFAGGALAAVHLVWRRTPRPACSPPGASRLRRVWTIEKWRWRRAGCLPYGVAIAVGGSWALLSGTGS